MGPMMKKPFIFRVSWGGTFSPEKSGRAISHEQLVHCEASSRKKQGISEK